MFPLAPAILTINNICEKNGASLFIEDLNEKKSSAIIKIIAESLNKTFTLISYDDNHYRLINNKEKKASVSESAITNALLTSSGIEQKIINYLKE